MGSFEKFLGRDDGPVVLVDGIEREALSARDLCGQLHISFRCPAIDVEAGLDAMAAQKG